MSLCATSVMPCFPFLHSQLSIIENPLWSGAAKMMWLSLLQIFIRNYSVSTGGEGYKHFLSFQVLFCSGRSWIPNKCNQEIEGSLPSFNPHSQHWGSTQGRQTENNRTPCVNKCNPFPSLLMGQRFHAGRGKLRNQRLPSSPSTLLIK